MRTVRHDSTDAPGQDSFLDIVANMVGIMILLVMVVGLRASREVSEQPQPTPIADKADEPTVSPEQVQAAVHKVAERREDVRTLVERAAGVRKAALLRQQERDWLVNFVAAAEQEIDQQRSQLDEQQQRDFDLRQQIAAAQRSLDDLSRQQVSFLSEPTEVHQIESLPTPLAKTVSGNEIHLCLAQGHVAFIPLDKLIDEMKRDAEENLWRLRNEDSLTSTVGPIGGFRLRYRMVRAGFATRSDGQVVSSGSYVRLARWELLPTSHRVGEPVEQALMPRSDLRYALQRNPAASTTITIWTYPDSFAEFRRLKETLFEAGYATAGRPLPEGVRIGGSPHGSRSAAQ